MKPNDKQIALMAQAAFDAAFEKAKELGYPGYEGLRGIIRAHQAAERFAVLALTLGPDGLGMLGKAIEEGMAKDAVRQAEDILKGEG